MEHKIAAALVVFLILVALGYALLHESEEPVGGLTVDAANVKPKTAAVQLTSDGDGSVAAPPDSTDRAPVDLKALWAHAVAGDAQAALDLSGERAVGGDWTGAMEVLRLPAVHNDKRVQRLLASHLEELLFFQVRSCSSVIRRKLVDELFELRRSLASKWGGEERKRYKALAATPDRYSRDDLAANYFKVLLKPDELKCKPSTFRKFWDKLLVAQ